MHILMLARQGIVPIPVARRCLKGLDALDRRELAEATYDGKYEDLFFYVEAAFGARCGWKSPGICTPPAAATTST